MWATQQGLLYHAGHPQSVITPQRPLTKRYYATLATHKAFLRNTNHPETPLQQTKTARNTVIWVTHIVFLQHLTHSELLTQHVVHSGRVFIPCQPLTNHYDIITRATETALLQHIGPSKIHYYINRTITAPQKELLQNAKHSDYYCRMWASAKSRLRNVSFFNIITIRSLLSNTVTV